MFAEASGGDGPVCCARRCRRSERRVHAEGDDSAALTEGVGWASKLATLGERLPIYLLDALLYETIPVVTARRSGGVPGGGGGLLARTGAQRRTPHMDRGTPRGV